MKILVTGSSGFIGYHLVKKLIKDGHKVIGIDNHNDYYDVQLKELRNKLNQSNNFNFYLQDINNIDIQDTDIDLAVNLAAQAGVRVSKDKEYLYEQSNVHGFEAFCDFCRQKDIKKIIYASSSSVYSDNHTEKFKEEFTNLAPKSIYGHSKLKNEIFASNFCKSEDISMIGLRFFSVYGPFGRPDMAYFLFASAAQTNRPILLNNKGNMSRDMTFIDDVIDGILGAISYSNENPKNKHEIFNLGNDNPILTSDLLEIINDNFNTQIQTKHAQTKNEALMTHADITKAKNLLGYEPKVSIKDGMNAFLEWYKNYENL